MSLETRLTAFAVRVATEVSNVRASLVDYVTLNTTQNISGAKRFTSTTLPHPPIHRSPDASPPPSPQIDDLWIVEDAYPASSPPNFAIGSTDPGLAQGMWVQTGLGPNGDDITIWIEDGT